METKIKLRDETVVISSDRPLPIERQNIRWAKVLRAMKEGDSFIASSYDNKNSIYVIAQRLFKKITMQKQKDGTYLIWLLNSDTRKRKDIMETRLEKRNGDYI